MSILRESIPHFEITVPLVVVGAGACGFTAALAARDRGVEVIVLERDKRPWGSTSMSLGAVCGVATAAQRAQGIEDSVELFIADVMEKTQGEADPALTRLIGERSGPTLDWLASTHAVPLQLDFKWSGLGHSRPRLHLPPGRNGAELLALLANACARAGAELVTEAQVTDLYAVGDRVVGLRIARPGGVVEHLGCEALILATCGFGGNPAMVAEHIPEMANARYFGHEGNRGDGILWGHALGGAVADMSAYQGLGTLAEPQQIVVPHPLLIDGGFLVNNLGRRFTHELANISGMCVPVLAQPAGSAWVIFDERRHAACLEHSVEQRQLVEVGAIRRGTHWGELERACDLPPGSLEAEAAAIDAARERGAVDHLGRDFAGLAPLQAPFCAIRVTGALFHTQGGLHINHQARVTRADGRPLPNLYAGGGAARSISGARVTGYLPAVGLCMAITLGAIAGNAAAAALEPAGRSEAAAVTAAADVIIKEITLPRAAGEPALPVRVAAPAQGRQLPVIVFSHGAYSSKDDYAPILDHWAAHGYVVLAVTHRDSTRLGATRGQSDPRFTLWRVADMRLLLDRLDQALAQVPGLDERTDRSRVAIAGHSFGGLIAQTLGGAPLRNPATGEAVSHRHPALRAVLVFSGAGPLPPVLQTEDFAALTLPTLVTVGSEDLAQAPGLTGYEWRRQPYDLIAPGDKYLLVLEGADHYLGGLVGRDDLPRSSAAAAYLKAFNRASLLFFDAWLKGDLAAQTTLRRWPTSASPFDERATLEQR